MEETEDVSKDSDPGNVTSTPNTSPKLKPKPRGKKRKRMERDSGSDSDASLPENAYEVEKNLIASAVKNNLDDVSVKKILKKVVTNDHVLALVKLREEEESNTVESKHIPKLTRAKVKELTKVSPKSAPWNLQNLELTPIKHIPVKTRPEVKALIAQELPEDEDDEEYEPTHDEVPSDDDQGLESCSDLDSQPRTPATPSQPRVSPKIVKDGPFKVPQEVSTPTRRKLQLDEEEATIALRTRSKLCLSETPIEHIESSFVPPDELPVPVVDDHLWNDFLNECLNPASVSKHEDDDETDPEYNVAADPDAPDDDDEEALERSIIKISKKELNDLVTELFNIMPEASVDDELANMANIASGVLSEQVNNQTPPRWEGKQEAGSEDEASVKMVDRIVFERRSSITKVSVGKMEQEDAFVDYDALDDASSEQRRPEVSKSRDTSAAVDMLLEERARGPGSPGGSDGPGAAGGPPPPLRALVQPPTTHFLHVALPADNVILPEQLQILQQQLRQHVQLATSNFLQLYVNPIHWSFGPTYKEYLEALVKIADEKPSSVVDVCNLRPALELCSTWEAAVSADTPENKQMVEFIQAQADRCQRRIANNNFYAGDFHETLLRTVANSTVFLYPFLLPAMPYRAVPSRRFSYTLAEDSLIALGLDQFWEYVESNPALYKKPSRPSARHRWGLGHTVELLVKHMFPWLSHKVLMGHVMRVRRTGEKDNPITKFFSDRTVEPVKHRLLPFNPALTLYEQPEHEMPRIWLRYLSSTSKRFKQYLNRRRTSRTHFIGETPAGVEVSLGVESELPPKKPLPIEFTREILAKRLNVNPPTIKPVQTDKFDLHIQKPESDASSSLYKLVETSSGVNLVPLKVVKKLPPEVQKRISDTNTVDCNVTPISSSIEVRKDLFEDSQDKSTEGLSDSEHCKCCVLLRSICKKQKVITDYFKSSRERSEPCPCRQRRGPKISNRLRILVDRYKRRSGCIYRDLLKKLESDDEENNGDDDGDCDRRNAEDLAIATAYQIKLTLRSSIAQNIYIKKRIYTLFSKFDPSTDDPIMLAAQLESAFKVEMADLHREFLGFLTAEQAERIGRFEDYFLLNCVEGLVEKIEAEVSDRSRRRALVSALVSALQAARAARAARGGACALCAALLARMRGLPGLARHTFRLFPHWLTALEPDPEETIVPDQMTVSAQDRGTGDQDHPDETLTNGDGTHTAPDYEADHSSSGEESETDSVSCEKPDPSMAEMSEDHTPCKTEQTDDSSDMSMMIMSEDEPIKSEPTEWKREEDKLILEYVIKVNLTPEERNDKSVMEILEEKQVVKSLAQNLSNKSIEALKGRIMYLLNILLGSER